MKYLRYIEFYSKFWFYNISRYSHFFSMFYKPEMNFKFLRYFIHWAIDTLTSLVYAKDKTSKNFKGVITMKTVTLLHWQNNRGEESLTSFQFLFMHKDTSWDGYKICKISLRYTLIVSITLVLFKCNGYTTCSGEELRIDR